MTERNPEQRVVDEIDRLVNETMAAGLDRWGRPYDDYSADRYPRCAGCDHEWHGVVCRFCACPSSSSVAKQKRVDWSDDNIRITAGSTVSVTSDPIDEEGFGNDCAAALDSAPWNVDSRDARSAQHPRVRFWWMEDDALEMEMVEGNLEIIDTCYVMDRAPYYRKIVGRLIDPQFMHGNGFLENGFIYFQGRPGGFIYFRDSASTRPIGPSVPGLILVEMLRSGSFEQISCLPMNGFQIETRRERTDREIIVTMDEVPRDVYQALIGEL